MIGYDAWKQRVPDVFDAPHAERIADIVSQVREDALSIGIGKKHADKIADDLREALEEYAIEDFEPELHEE